MKGVETAPQLNSKTEKASRHHFFSLVLKEQIMPKSTDLPPNQDQKKYQQEETTDLGKRGFDQGEGQGGSESNYKPRQENLSNRGYQEDQPGNPVRTTGSNREDQESGSIQPGDEREGKN